MSRERTLLIAALALLLALAVSAIRPYDLATWLLEISPILIALPIMFASYRRFPLTTLLYVLIFLHALVLMAGGHYTYARVPLGYWMEHAFSFHRNDYDKIGHFMQGFVPFLVAREILLRGGYVIGRKMAAFLSICVVMFVSSFYELIEWWTALAMGQGATEFLGTQGDPWDTQSDMFMALIGASVALLTMTRLHDRQMAKIQQGK